ncbi:MAG: UDP-3-O-(3-hydroxymyristoyl)glucosamine N-acyltransferase [Bacteroidales bacterium]|jgi:UDP-3-O-[3-hydroxymyristoyl] glucosamine N-acyltransferase|nr:UDP-3-O-(3-hydroxymyristoyl)glucosamine N-acyltransferase [Bacteroidales bacterium]
MKYTTLQLAELLGGFVEGDETLIITKPSKIEEGTHETVSFLANPKYTPYIYDTKASAVICNKSLELEHKVSVTLIRVDDAYSAFAKLLNIYAKSTKELKGKSCRARVHKKCKIGKNVYLGDFVSIANNCTIGDNTKIYPNVTIYENVTIGSNCLIHAGAVVLNDCVIGNNCIVLPGAVIGGDGFGFAPITDGKYMKIPQTGNVILEDNVEIGTNSTIDRATMGSTIIHKGTKIDNLIQIGHNCEVGSDTVIAGQTGISGSTKVGNNCMIGGQVGVAGHLKIGNNVQIAAKSGVMANIDDKQAHMGAPSIDARQYKKSYIGFMQLDKIMRRVSQLEKELEALKNKE